jgi:acyl-CoA oxidase
VLVGDCGHKSGLNGVDNGFILFENYRIPKDYLLDKLSCIDEKGEFVSAIKSD